MIATLGKQTTGRGRPAEDLEVRIPPIVQATGTPACRIPTAGIWTALIHILRQQRIRAVIILIKRGDSRHHFYLLRGPVAPSANLLGWKDKLMTLKITNILPFANVCRLQEHKSQSYLDISLFFFFLNYYVFWGLICYPTGILKDNIWVSSVKQFVFIVLKSGHCYRDSGSRHQGSVPKFRHIQNIFMLPNKHNCG